MKSILTFTLFLAIFFTSFSPASASTSWNNTITIEENNTITWNYTETLTGADSIHYKTEIDQLLGNNDSYLSAWELLLADKQARSTLKSRILKEIDVKVNSSNATLKDVDAELSLEALGNTTKPTSITNKYQTSYTYQLEKEGGNTSFWFLGEPETPVTITLPPDTVLLDSLGIQNLTQTETDNRTILAGTINRENQTPPENQTSPENRDKKGEITLKIKWQTQTNKTNTSRIQPETKEKEDTFKGEIFKIKSPAEKNVIFVLTLMLLILLVLLYKVLTTHKKL